MLRFISVCLLIAATACSGKSRDGASSDGRPPDLPPTSKKVASPFIMAPMALKKPGTTEVKAAAPKVDPDVESLDRARAGLARYAAAALAFPAGGVPSTRYPLLKKLVMAARKIDEVYLRQVYRRNPVALGQIRKAVRGAPEKKPILDYFHINYGVWDRSWELRPFWGTRERLPGGGFYDDRMTRTTFSRYLNFIEATLQSMGEHPKLLKDRKARAELVAQLEELRSPFTLVDRKDGKFLTTPYSEAFKYHLELAAGYLKDAGGLASEYTLKRYLTLRARALVDNRYEPSERALMAEQGPLLAHIGPAYTHDDQLMGYKASFGALLLLKDAALSAELRSIWRLLPRFAATDDRAKFALDRFPATCPVWAADELYSTGYFRAGPHPVSFVYPFAYGFAPGGGQEYSALLANVVRAKFTGVIDPLSRRILNPDQHRYLTSEAFLKEQMLLELARYVRPTPRLVKRQAVTAVDRLQKHYPEVAAARDRVAALSLLGWLVTRQRRGTEADLKAGYVTVLASIFRYLLVNPRQVYARGGLILLNRLMADKAVTLDMAALTFTVHFEKVPGTVEVLLRELLTLMEKGDEAEAGAFLKRWTQLPPTIARIIEKNKDSHVDIVPSYPLLPLLGIEGDHLR